ncbi:actin cytoskeleton organization protein [Fistulina hepatica ATCC 64428]|nr:actin cytoskeleton organization protein [Fistulina hepatica ATCC 64428]
MSAAALDRQIRLIYDAIDTGSNKSAIVSCTKFLKKHPNNQLVKALKSLALVRAQKVEESLALCDEVLASKPTNEAVLTAMMHVLRALGRNLDMVAMFEEAYKQQPTNDDLGAQTFFANVRAGRWKSAQQIASKMFKQFNDDKYLYWSVVSAVLQANDPLTPANMRMILYKLAGRLLQSSSTPSYVTPDRFHLHLSVLRELGQFEEAHILLNTDIGKSICTTSLICNEVRRDIWRAKGLILEEGQDAAQRIMEKHDRNYLEFMSVLDATFSYVAAEENAENAAEQCAKHIAKTRELMQQIGTSDGRKDRSAHLALVELEHRAIQHGVVSDPSGLLGQLRIYFDLFGNKTCCFEDLKPFALHGDHLAQWRAFLQAFTESFTTLDELSRNINSHKLLRYNLPEQPTLESELASVSLLAEQYVQALPLGEGLPATELQPSDDLAVLASNVLVNLWTMTGDVKYLYAAVTLLEYGLMKSKQSYAMRLTAIRIYRLLVAPAQALEHYRGLNIKQVQLDTLSHYFLSRGSTFSLASLGDLTISSECQETVQIYLSNTQETGEFVTRAFTTEKYSQIPEFITFEDRLDNSLQRDLVKMEHLRMRLAHEPVSNDIVDMELLELKFIFDRFHHDNRDFDVLPSYQPASCKSFNEQTIMFGTQEGSGWLSIFLKVYIRAFQQASDLDDTVEERLLIGDRPKQLIDSRETLQDRLIHFTDEELAELTEEERRFVEFARALADWLEPYHNHTRPSPSTVLAEAARISELKTGLPLKGVDIPPKGENGHTNGKKNEEPPAVTDAPKIVVQFFDEIQKRFEEVRDRRSLLNTLHVANVAQEAFLLFIVETSRFKNNSVVKIHKLGALVQSFKTIRTNAIAALRVIAESLVKWGQEEATAEARSAFVDASVSLMYVVQLDHDFVLGVAKKTTDARKKMIEGFGKGMQRICTTYA